MSTAYGNGIAISMWTIPLTYSIINNVPRSLGITISIKTIYSVLTVTFICAFLLFGILIPTVFYVYPINSLGWRLLIILLACTTYCISYPVILALFLGQPIIAYLSKRILLFFVIAIFSLLIIVPSFPSDKVPINHILDLQRLGVHAERIVRFGLGTVMESEYEHILHYCGRERSIRFDQTTRSRSLEIVSFMHFPLIFVSSILYPFGGLMGFVSVLVFGSALFLLIILILYILGYTPIDSLMLVVLFSMIGGMVMLYIHRYVLIQLKIFFIIQMIVWFLVDYRFALRLHREFYFFSTGLLFLFCIGPSLVFSTLSFLVAIFIGDPSLYIYSSACYVVSGLFLYEAFDRYTW